MASKKGAKRSTSSAAAPQRSGSMVEKQMPNKGGKSSTSTRS